MVLFCKFVALQGSEQDRKVTWVNRFLFQQKKEDTVLDRRQKMLPIPTVPHT